MSTSSLMSTTTSPLPAVVATLPVEVEEGIIDKLHYHVDALRNCALTCRRWQPRTRYHLFAAIRVRMRDELFSLCTSLSQSPHLRPLVRSLTFHAKLGRDDPELATLFQMVPVPLLTSLPNLVCWKFSGPFCYDSPPLAKNCTPLPPHRTRDDTKTCYYRAGTPPDPIVFYHSC